MAEKAFYLMTTREALDALDTTEKGLPRAEAEKRRGEFGSNDITSDVAVPKLLLFLSQFKDLLVLVLIFAGAISFAIGSVRDGSVMFVIVIVNALIGFVQEYKASRLLERLKELISSPAKLRVNGELSEIAQSLLVPGDIVQIEAGDKIPADIRILEAFNLRANEFSLTGESTSQEKNNNAAKEECVLADRENMAYMGTTVATGNAIGVVVRTGMHTEMGKIADMTQETTAARSPMQIELNMLARWLTGIVVIISFALFGVALWQGFGLFMSMVYALGVAVAAVPQALPAQVTVALSAASKRLADRKAVVKNLPSVETLGSTTVICTDKTGTLTKNEMTVTTLWFNGKSHEVTGIGYKPEGQILDEDKNPLSREKMDELEIMLDAATMASNAEIHPPDDEHHGWHPIGDPTEAALITLSTKAGTRSPKEDEENPELHEFPFDSERKRMSSVRQFGNRSQLAMKGAADSVLSVAKFIYRDGEAVAITEEDKRRIEEISELWSSQALRVIAIAFRPLEENGGDYVLEEVEKDVVLLGLVGMIDPPKEGVREAIASCREAHIRIIIMTGDHAITAQAVGREIGLSDGEDPPVCTGARMEAMDDSELTALLLSSDAVIFSRVAPEDKLRIVKLLEAQGEVVAVTGDGVNDAPALKRAAIGVAMGQTGTDVAKEAAEVVLLDDSFPTLVEAVREGRTIYNNLRKTVLASLTTNMAELVVVLLGLVGVAAGNWAIPILAIQILAVDLLAEVMPLTFLTFDPPPDNVMQMLPRDRHSHIMNLWSSLEVAFLGGLIGVLAFANFGLFMFREGIILSPDMMGTPEFAKATAVTYLTIAYCQFVNILSRRHEYTSLFNRNLFTNRVLLLSILGSILMVFLGIYGPIISDFLVFIGPGPVDWIFVLAAAVLYLAVFETIKLFRRKKRAKSKLALAGKLGKSAAPARAK
ncbi:MAG: cation-translocating P-type ATPase [Thermovirgaceae bacterium]|nr:cation-translocating P-type ATPase [Thermovirgaceae bacterium]